MNMNYVIIIYKSIVRKRGKLCEMGITPSSLPHSTTEISDHAEQDDGCKDDKHNDQKAI